jgi:hypothetical protein
VSPDDVKARVERIRQLAGDPESAHSAEDRLYVTVLAVIAGGVDADTAKELAYEAVAAGEIDFPRWYA